MPTATIEQPPEKVNPAHYVIPERVKCKKHGPVKPWWQAKRTKTGQLRIHMRCPKKDCFLGFARKRASEYTREEIAWALKYLPYKMSSDGLFIPEPSWTELLIVDTSCLGCVRQKATWLVRGWTKHKEAVKAFVCSSCKRKLQDYHGYLRNKHRRD